MNFSTFKLFAVKIERKATHLAKREISLLERLSHCNIMQIVESSAIQGEVRMIFELCVGGTMLEFLASSNSNASVEEMYSIDNVR